MTLRQRRVATGLLAALAAFGSSPAARADAPAGTATTIEARAATR